MIIAGKKAVINLLLYFLPGNSYLTFAANISLNEKVGIDCYVFICIQFVFYRYCRRTMFYLCKNCFTNGRETCKGDELCYCLPHGRTFCNCWIYWLALVEEPEGRRSVTAVNHFLFYQSKSSLNLYASINCI